MKLTLLWCIQYEWKSSWNILDLFDGKVDFVYFRLGCTLQELKKEKGKNKSWGVGFGANTNKVKTDKWRV